MKPITILTTRNSILVSIQFNAGKLKTRRKISISKMYTQSNFHISLVTTCELEINQLKIKHQ